MACVRAGSEILVFSGVARPQTPGPLHSNIAMPWPLYDLYVRSPKLQPHPFPLLELQHFIDTRQRQPMIIVGEAAVVNSTPSAPSPIPLLLFFSAPYAVT